jgi:hypothetical protein
MYEQIEKPKENKSKSVANSVNQKKSNDTHGLGFVDNREQSVAQCQLAGLISNNAPIQMETIINHRSNSFTHTNGPTKVGAGMEATLDPNDIVQGSEPNGQKDLMADLKKTLPANKFVRGHLLNHDLGGYGVEENLFPITTQANGKHLRTVEYGVKKLLNEANSETTSTYKPGVRYEVAVGGQLTEGDFHKPSTFRCVAYGLTNVNDLTAPTFGDGISVDVVSTPKIGVADDPASATTTLEALDDHIGINDMHQASYDDLIAHLQSIDGNAAGSHKHAAPLGNWKHVGGSQKKNNEGRVNNHVTIDGVTPPKKA